MEKKQNYKRKNYYHKPGGGGTGGGSNNWNNKRKFKNYLQPGIKGFMCTCNAKFREKECVKESINILNEYADKIFGADDIQRPSSTNEDTEGGAGGDVASGGDIEDDLKKEISNLRASQWTPGRFTVVDTGVQAIIFIKTTLEDPVKLAHTILSEAAATKTQKGRFLLRLVPVEVVCRANMEDMKTAADSLFDKHFKCDPTTFAIVVNKRYNDSLLRDEVIQALALLVTDKNREHKANLKEPNRTVLVEIFKGMCLMSVLEDYKTLRHYNIAELTKPDEGETEKESQVEAEKQEENVEENKEEDMGEDHGEAEDKGGENDDSSTKENDLAKEEKVVNSCDTTDETA
ncbi:THUMP domain-containing protein 1 homolog [Macrosteles quadrilineatus]|uniref:THUMP domain-containing protein 1 homolog n=1 Tax=Macrosteles quadrilineatus TaxID=74068 RepID=UPI0023E2DD7C|nr:THUMP domain-containing protein 1 homolog [Macrosteles quadrilineatus]